MQGITVNVGPPPPPPGPPPPPPAGGQPRYVVRGHAIPLEPHKLLALGNLGIGIALIVVNALSFIGTFITFQLLAFVILLFLVLGGTSLQIMHCVVELRYFLALLRDEAVLLLPYFGHGL